jgi:hypothetical protein
VREREPAHEEENEGATTFICLIPARDLMWTDAEVMLMYLFVFFEDGAGEERVGERERLQFFPLAVISHNCPWMAF